MKFNRCEIISDIIEIHGIYVEHDNDINYPYVIVVTSIINTNIVIDGNYKLYNEMGKLMVNKIIKGDIVTKIIF